MSSTPSYTGNISSPFSTHSVLVREIGKHKTVLDVGCYTGYLGKYADRSNVFYGLDNEPQALKKAKKIYKDVLLYDVERLKKLPWNKRFDCLVFADILEHVRNPLEVLHFFTKHYLKKGGIILISLPNIANWTIRLKLLFGRFSYTETGILDRTHVHFYTFQTAKALVTKAGLHSRQELYGSDYFGYLIKLSGGLPKGLFATNIILVCDAS